MLLSDMTTIKPVPRGHILFGDPPVEYKIMSLVDLTYDQMIDFTTPMSKEEIETTTLPEIMVRMRARIKNICPNMPDNVLSAMTFRNLNDFVSAAMGSGENPPSATVEADSVSSTS